MSLLTLAYLNPSLEPVPARLSVRAQLEFWLTNPLLLTVYPQRMAATAEKARMLTNPAGFHELLLSLQAAAKPLRNQMWAKYPPLGSTSYDDVKKAIDTPHIDGRKREELCRFLTTLSTVEYEWIRAYVQEVVDAKEAALQEQHEQQYNQDHTHDELAA